MDTQKDHREWVTVALIVGCYGLWVLAGVLWTTGFWPLTLLCLPVLTAFHTSLQHETIHGHPTRWGWLNEALVSLSLVMVFPYRRYRDLHQKHHTDEHLTDPYEDPESYFWPEGQVRGMSDFTRLLFALNNTLVGRLVIGPMLSMIGFARTEVARLRRDEPGVRQAWGLHGLGLVVVVLVVTQVFAMSLLTYAVFVVYPALALTLLRSYAEHQAAEAVGARTAVTEAHPALGLLYLNNNLHIVHHAHPRVPWYDIPKLYAERREHYLRANENTVFMGYSDIFRRFAFRVKQPVEHPLMYRDEGVQPAAPSDGLSQPQ